MSNKTREDAQLTARERNRCQTITKHVRGGLVSLNGRTHVVPDRFETCGKLDPAPWDEARTEPAIRNVVSPLVMELETRTVPPEVVKTIRNALTLKAFSFRERDRVLDYLAAVYDVNGEPRED